MEMCCLSVLVSITFLFIVVVVVFFGATSFCLWVLLCFVFGLFFVVCWLWGEGFCFTSCMVWVGCGCGGCWVLLVVDKVYTYAI